jgi:hypothetical protein
MQSAVSAVEGKGMGELLDRLLAGFGVDRGAARTAVGIVLIVDADVGRFV